MIQTSYYGNKDLRHVAGKLRLVSISQSSPRTYRGEDYKLLAPPWELVKMKDEERYTQIYRSKILGRLDPLKVARDLEGSVLLCWEKPGEFCHRRLVAEWLHDAAGVAVPELVWPDSIEKPQNEQLDLFANV